MPDSTRTRQVAPASERVRLPVWPLDVKVRIWSWSPQGRRRRLDPNQRRRYGAEPSVVRRITEHADDRLVQCLGRADHSVHQGMTDASTLVVGVTGSRKSVSAGWSRPRRARRARAGRRVHLRALSRRRWKRARGNRQDLLLCREGGGNKKLHLAKAGQLTATAGSGGDDIVAQFAGVSPPVPILGSSTMTGIRLGHARRSSLNQPDTPSRRVAKAWRVRRR